MIKVLFFYDLNVLWLPFLQRVGQSEGRAVLVQWTKRLYIKKLLITPLWKSEGTILELQELFLFTVVFSGIIDHIKVDPNAKVS